MKPISSHTMSRLVCTMRAMLNGMCREQQVADQVLQAQRDTEDDLPDEQAERADEVQPRHRLRLEFEMGLVGSWCVPPQPSMLGGHFSVLMRLVHFRNSVQVVELLLVEVELRHLAAARGRGRLGLHPGLDEVGAASPPRRMYTLPSSGAK
jgi:hypothetical protein